MATKKTIKYILRHNLSPGYPAYNFEEWAGGSVARQWGFDKFYDCDGYLFRIYATEYAPFGSDNAVAVRGEVLHSIPLNGKGFEYVEDDTQREVYLKTEEERRLEMIERRVAHENPTDLEKSAKWCVRSGSGPVLPCFYYNGDDPAFFSFVAGFCPKVDILDGQFGACWYDPSLGIDIFALNGHMIIAASESQITMVSVADFRREFKIVALDHAPAQ